MSSRRLFLSPSDLTFAWGGCHRCLWLQYNHGLRVPGFMPLVKEMADLQESYFKDVETQYLHPDIPAGKVVERGGNVLSVPIEIDGRVTHLSIKGIYDLLVEFPDGSFGIIDCKIQAKANDKSKFYSPQLEAYAFALENPKRGEPKQITHIGIYAWSLPNSASGNINHGFGFKLDHNWFPIERNPEAFQNRLREFITMIDGPMPASADTCDQCRYIEARSDAIKSDQE
jgi:hypothetical protein